MILYSIFYSQFSEKGFQVGVNAVVIYCEKGFQVIRRLEHSGALLLFLFIVRKVSRGNETF